MSGANDYIGPVNEDEPMFRVVRGRPTDEELAALVVVLSSLPRASAALPTPAPSSGWSAPWRSVRQPLHPGAGAWRMSGRG